MIDLDIKFVIRKTPFYYNINVSFFINAYDLITIIIANGYAIYLIHKSLFFPIMYIIKLRKKNDDQVILFQ